MFREICMDALLKQRFERTLQKRLSAHQAESGKKWNERVSELAQNGQSDGSSTANALEEHHRNWLFDGLRILVTAFLENLSPLEPSTAEEKDKLVAQVLDKARPHVDGSCKNQIQHQ